MLSDQILQEQIAYYRSRAGEYDQWFFRQGRYDRGVTANQVWFAEVEDVVHALDTFRPMGHVLELAGGTGLWTKRLAKWADTVTVVDASAEVLALNQARVAQPTRVSYIEADLFAWTPSRRYDTVFFSFWLSHVPPDRVAWFWNLVKSALVPGGRVFLIDSLRDPSSTAVDHTLPVPETPILTRRLNNQQEFQIYKVFYTPATLGEQLSRLGWQPMLSATEHYFLYGSAVISD